MEDKTITIVCLVSSLSGLLLIYIAAVNIQPRQLPLGEVNFDLTGRSVMTTGYVSYVSKHPNGHIFLTLSDGSSALQVPLFSGFVNSMKNDGINPNFHRGDVLEIEGLVGEYQGQLQIVPRKTSDVRLMEDGYAS
jgi:DNA/RNA endonuclease YhcR with UshA esterase domain